ncbi:HAD family hydrolase, partial [Streptomyces albidoflavus]
ICLPVRHRGIVSGYVWLLDTDPRPSSGQLHADEPSPHVDWSEGAVELLTALPADRWALVTSNYEHRVRGRFGRTGLPMPALVIDAASVAEGKPSPVPYLTAAEKLGADPAECLVIEDAPSGVRSGLAAGMTVWTVNTPAAHPGEHRHFPTLAEAAPHILAELG